MMRTALSEWLLTKRISTSKFRDLIEKERGNGPLSIYTVDSWRSGKSVPRGRSMAAIEAVTKRQVIASDFIRLDK